jgi:demethylmenaquinone methyltransferase/2-methoxy-6-polyprenyl-1,4-benzoquinol methylase
MKTTSGAPPTPMGPADGSGNMFDRIAPRYDLLNRIMSFGLDLWWRRQLVRTLRMPATGHALDVATGTADVALALARYLPQATITGLDPSSAMLAQGQRKLAASPVGRRIRLVAGDAQALPFADATFDAACISFGIRNVPNRKRGLEEMVRVVKPGGRIVVLELGEPQDGLLAPLARWHVHTVVPTVGAWLSGAAEYRYLQRSIAAFLPPPAFVALCRQAGLEKMQHRRLSFGAVNMFWGDKPLG